MIHFVFKKHTGSTLFILFLAAVVSACTSVPGSPSGSATPIHTPGTSDRQELTIERDLKYGPGPFELPDPKIGLADLSGYTTTLTMAFDGTRDGNPEKWSKTYTMLASRDPQARQWTIEKSGNAANPESVFMAEMGGLDYERRGEKACLAHRIQEGNTLPDRLELASFLSPVIGAQVSGDETVNSIAAKRYSFDQQALGEQSLTKATGDLWVATEGNYIVKYLLTRKGKADYFGDGVEGTLTLDYELTNPNQPVTIQLPEDCPPGMVDAPLLQDASKVEKTPGTLRYETTTSLKDVAAFYQKQLPDLGWQAEGESGVTDTAAFLNYRKGSQMMMIIIRTSANGTAVQILLENVQK